LEEIKYFFVKLRSHLEKLISWKDVNFIKMHQGLRYFKILYLQFDEEGLKMH